MAEATVVACLERTAKLLIWEANFLIGVSKQVRDVQVQLEKLKSFLKDADRKRRREDVFRWVREVREVALSMEDVLETYAVDVESRRELGQLKQFITRCCDIFGECITLHKLDPEIKSIQKKLTRLAESKESLKLEELGESSNAEQEKQVVSEAKFSRLMEPDFVGREKEIQKIVSHLKNKRRVCQVVSIWGMGGQGKTTLARKVYNDVKSHFEASTWVCLAQNFEPLSVLQEILKGLTNVTPAGELNQLQEKLHEVLTDKKCLVVVDDIWSEDHWKILKLAFPLGEEDCGTKILLTTRNERVANLGFPYRLGRLTEDEGWNLLVKKAFPTRDNDDYDPYAEDRVDKQKEKTGREIVQKCEGLPLAISALGGVLKGKRDLNDWKSVNRDISSTLNNSDDEYGTVRRILERSYDDLSFRYKQLFLYLGNYGEDEKIDTRRLYQLWIAEGMVSSGVKQAKGNILMDVAESYLNELAERSLVQVTPPSDIDEPWLKFGSCRLHDLIRDLCLMKRKEEEILNLTAIRDTHSESFDFQAVVIELSALANYVYDGSDSRVSLEKQESGQIRSLAFISHHELPQIVQNLPEFKLVRILNLDDFEFEHRRLPQELCYLIHLRYLSLVGCKLNELPSFIGDLRYLETLDLTIEDDESDIFMIPNVLWKLTRLKQLYLPCLYSSTSGTLLNFDGLNELEVLRNFNVGVCNIDDLVALARLQIIEIMMVSSSKELEGALKVIASKRFSSLLVGNVDLMSSVPSGSVVSSSNYLTRLLECASLHKLILYQDVGGSFPKEINTQNFSQSLVTISLMSCGFKEDPMPFLEMLPSLTDLSIIQNAYLGAEIVCSAIGFPRLRDLDLTSLDNLKTWRLEKGSMPNLLTLYIESCVELEMLPESMESLKSLKSIIILEMPEAFVDRIKGTKAGEEGQDFHKIRHVPLITVNDELIRRN